MPLTEQQKRKQDLLTLGRFIVNEYNRVTGIWAYDPEGFYQDVHQQLDRIFAKEINAINEVAEAERKRLYSVDLKILRLEFELAVERSLNRAYVQIFEAQERLRNGEPVCLNLVDKEMQDIGYELTNNVRESIAMPLRAFNISRAERMAKFEEWVERTYF